MKREYNIEMTSSTLTRIMIQYQDIANRQVQESGEAAEELRNSLAINSFQNWQWDMETPSSLTWGFFSP